MSFYSKLEAAACSFIPLFLSELVKHFDAIELEYVNGEVFSAISLSNDSRSRCVLSASDSFGGSPPLESLADTLSVSLVASQISENGGVTTGSVTRSTTDLSQPLTVQLSSNNPSKISIPSSVVIPAFGTSVTFPVTAIDNNLVEGTQAVSINAVAQNYVVSLDPGWGTAGVAQLPGFRSDLEPTTIRMLVQPDGKTLTVGRSPSDNAWNVYRLNTDGSLDSSFGLGGIASTTWTQAVFPYGLSVYPDGQILVVGSDRSAGGHLIARYNANGTLNLQIGRQTLIYFATDIAADLSSSSDGGFFVGGTQWNSVQEMAVVRYRNDGSVDTSFGNLGIALASSAPAATGGHMRQQADGKLLLAGSAGETNFGVARFHVNGSLDNSFGVNGISTISFGVSSNVESIALQPDGKIVLAGRTYTIQSDWAIARLDVNGNLDNSFSGDGKDLIDVGGNSRYPRGVGVAPDGKILVAGGNYIVRYNSNGTIDTGFDNAGFLYYNPVATFSEFRSVAVQSDGKILSLFGYNLVFNVQRFRSDPIYPVASGTLNVTDYEELNFNFPFTTFSEKASAFTASVTRSNTNIANALTVYLQSSDLTAVSVPTSVVIPANSASVNFAVVPIDDLVLDGTQFANVAATASGYVGASQALQINGDYSPPTSVVLTNTTVDENRSEGTQVGVLQTIDPDTNDSFVYMLVPGVGDSDNNQFSISNGSLVTSSVFNFEQRSTYTIRIRSTDLFGYFVEQPLTIGILDVNEPPTSVTLGPTSYRLFENSNTDSGIDLAAIIVNDDALGNEVVDLVGANAGSFEIVGDTLRLAPGVALDFETQPTIPVTVRVTDPTLVDGAGLPIYRTRTFTVTVLDFDESLPIVVSTTPTFASGTIPYGTTQFQVAFNKTIAGGNRGSNFELRSQGTDGILGTADDSFFDIQAGFALNESTLAFPGLAEGTYRFTVKNSIQDPDGRALDGNNDGLPGDSWNRDFVVVRSAAEPIQLVSSIPASVSAMNVLSTLDKPRGYAEGPVIPATNRRLISDDGRYVLFHRIATDNVTSGPVAYLRDLLTGESITIAVPNFTAPGFTYYFSPSLSSDGRYVVAENSRAIVKFDLATNTNVTVSTSASGTTSNGNSANASVSGDGRYIAFQSYGSNLVPNDTNSYSDIFVKDSWTGAIIRTSNGLSDPNANANANAGSSLPSLSNNGQFVVFVSEASNLVANDNNSFNDIFMKNLITGVMKTVSTNAIGQSADSSSSNPSVSNDGRYVVFDSMASNLVSGDTNGVSDVFVKDMQTGIIVRVSTEEDGTQWTGYSNAPSLSSDGRFVTFTSITGQVGDPTTNRPDVYRKDLQTGTLTRVSTNSDGVQGNGDSTNSSISLDGRSVAFSSYASNLVGSDNNNRADVFVKDTQSGMVELVSFSTAYNTARSGFGASTNVAGTITGETSEIRSPRLLSEDGRYQAFLSTANNLVVGDTNSYSDVFVRDTLTGKTVRASTSSSGVQANDGSSYVSLSGDGRYVAFTSAASNLVPLDTNSFQDIFVKDTVSGTISLVSTTSNGDQGYGVSQGSTISGNGRYVAFSSLASDLVPNDSNMVEDIFVKDTLTGTLVRASTSSLGGQSGSLSRNPSLSYDGRYVAFESGATGLLSGDLNAFTDIFVKNLQTGQTTLVSVTPGGIQGNGSSRLASISGDGRYVAFRSTANNLVPGDINGVDDIFVKDLETGTITLASVSAGGIQNTALSSFPSISFDGRYVTFSTVGSVAFGSDGNTLTDIFLKDMQTGELAWLSRYPILTSASSSFSPSLSPDGRYVAFASTGSGWGGIDTNNTTDVFRVSNPLSSAYNITVVTLTGPSGKVYDIDGSTHGSGQIIQGTDNAFDGLSRLIVDNNDFQPRAVQRSAVEDGGRTLITPTVTMSGVNVSREVTVPSAGTDDFARTIEVFSNPTQSPITVSARIVGNLGSDSQTMVFSTSDGDTIVEPTDTWFGTDDGIGVGSPAIVHLFRRPNGIQPMNVQVIDDNIVFDYQLTIPPNETVRLAHFTVVHSDRTTAVASGDALIGDSLSLGREAGAFLTSQEIDSIANFHLDLFAVTPNPASLAENNSTATRTEVATLSIIAPAISSLSYSITGPDVAFFELVGNKLFLKSGVALDFETKASYTIFISADAPGIGSTTDQTESFKLLVVDADEIAPRVTSSTPSLLSGSIALTTNSLAIDFDEPILGGNLASNFELRSQGSDGLLGTSDDVLVTLSANQSSSTTTLSFSDLPEGVYRLTVKDSITDLANNRLDGNSDGIANDNWTRDFNVVGAMIGPDMTLSIAMLSTAPIGSGASSMAQSGGRLVSDDGRYVVFTSLSQILIPGDTNNLSDVFRRDTQTGLIQIVSTTHNGLRANGSSSTPVISGDGRYVVFSSTATNLTSRADSNAVRDIFVKDMQTGEVVLVSTNVADEQTNGASTNPVLSNNGRYVAFASTASNLVTDDTNGVQDIFAKDLYTGYVTRVSTGVGGVQANALSRAPSISDDGRYVAFDSDANSLVADDNNSYSDVFVTDLQTGIVLRVSKTAAGTEVNNGVSFAPSISGDGQYIAFASSSSNLVPQDTSTLTDIFRKDIQSGAILHVSTNSLGAIVGGTATNPSMSSDGRYVSFSSTSDSYFIGVNNAFTDIFVKDTQTGAVKLASVTANGVRVNQTATIPSLSRDGSFVAFQSLATSFAPGDTNNVSDAFLKDLNSGTLQMTSYPDPSLIAYPAVPATGNGSSTTGASSSVARQVSSDGRYIVFESAATDLAPNDPNAASDIFVRDTTTGAIQIVSVSTSGVLGNAASYFPSISNDGRYVVFQSVATNLASNDTNSSSDVFRKDLVTGAVTLVSITQSSVQGNSASTNASISDDGRYVAFQSGSTNFFTNDMNSMSDVFVKDLNTGSLMLVSSDIYGNPGFGSSIAPMISRDGRMVVFDSTSSNLVPLDNNNMADVFVKDLMTGAVQQVSNYANWNQSHGESSPFISADGRYVTIDTTSALVADDTNGQADVYVKDMSTGSISRVSTGAMGQQGLSDSINAVISDDGRFVAFESDAPNLVSGDTNSSRDVFVKDLQTGAIARLLNTVNSLQDYAPTQNVTISSNGRFIAFSSFADNLYRLDTNNTSDVFIASNPLLPLARLSLASQTGFLFDIDRSGYGTGQLLHGSSNAFDGLNRLQVDGVDYAPDGNVLSVTDDNSRTLITPTVSMAELDVFREVTVSILGTHDFARTVDVFTNSTENDISIQVRIAGNLGSDLNTTVFATSDGDLVVEPTDWWFGTDDADGTGTPAIIHLVHGPAGLIPSSVAVVGDNVTWTYDLTVNAGDTMRLAQFTVLGTTRQQAIDAANALVTTSGYGGEAAAFLTPAELASLVNFQFNNNPPTAIALQNVTSSLPENSNTTTVRKLADIVVADDGIGSNVLSLAGADASAFRIVGNELYLRDGIVLDFEAKASYSVIVQVDDPSVGTGPDASIGYNLNLSDVQANIVQRRVFYNRSSAFFGGGAGDAAGSIDPMKEALLPGQAASNANYTNYARGLNGIIVDVDRGGRATAADFQFDAWNGISASGFQPISAAPTISVLPGAGAGSSSRVKIEFDDGLILNTWLRVTVLANSTTDLPVNDVFYFGNAVGDMFAGNVGSPIDVRVNATDTSAVRQNQSTAANSVDITRIHDVNKDGRVNATDTSIIRQNQLASIIRFFTAPSNSSILASQASEDRGDDLSVPMLSDTVFHSWVNPTNGPLDDDASLDGDAEPFEVGTMHFDERDVHEFASVPADLAQQVMKSKKSDWVDWEETLVDKVFADSFDSF